ncbi:MAG: DUF11 domain-containing protein [Cocleimonas sp.]|nr:DUF11 domain-containing protein [Cocleimonas sp.]
MKFIYQKQGLIIGCLILSVLFFNAQAKSPTAGTLIQNQATATYKDAAGVEQTATSNIVSTLIQQVGAMTLVEDKTSMSVAGNMVYLPHILTNTGNGDDTYHLTATNVSGDDYNFDLSLVSFYADVNKDGIPDSSASIISTGVLSPNEAFYLVVGVMVPVSATKNQQGKLSLTGRSTFVENPVDLDIKQTNTDTIIVSDDAVISVVKSMNANRGASPSGAYTITLTYKNTGRVAATNVVLMDTLPSGMRYFSDGGMDHALWSKGSITLSDTNQDNQSGITYCAYDPSCSSAPFSSSKVTAVIDNIPAGTTGKISFEVMIDASLPVSTLKNIAEFSYHNGSGSIPVAKTNQVPFDIMPQPNVVANGANSNIDGVDNKGGTTDAFIVDVATRGETVVFNNMIHNTGNSNDVFDMTVDAANTTFPVGTVFQLFQADGFTPLMDTNNNGIDDTGIVASGAYYKVVLKAVLPANAEGSTGFEIVKTATSSLDSRIFNTVIDRLNRITGDSVDLTNDAAGAGAAGAGLGPETNAVTTKNIMANGSVIFSLFINNTSDQQGSYELQYSIKKPFEAHAIEAGWKISLHHTGTTGDCSTLGKISNSTGNIVAHQSQQMCAKVSAPANAVADGKRHPIYFKVLSRLTGASDIKHDAVKLIMQPKLSIAPNQAGQVEPANAVIYSHHVTNNGNTDLECVHVTATDLDPQSGWSSVIYNDMNDDGKLDAGDKPLTKQTLKAGQGFSLLIKVFAPATAPMGIKNIQKLVLMGHQDNGDGNATTCVGSVLRDAVQDVTSVNTSKVVIVKRQAMDANCDSVAEGAFTTTPFQVDLGACILYQLTATNTGSTNVKNARIDDATPTFTQFIGIPSVTSGNIIGGALGTEGIIAGGSVTKGVNVVLKSGESLVLVFGVKLD